MPFVATWMELEDTNILENKTYIEIQVPHIPIHFGGYTS